MLNRKDLFKFAGENTDAANGKMCLTRWYKWKVSKQETILDFSEHIYHRRVITPWNNMTEESVNASINHTKK